MRIFPRQSTAEEKLRRTLAATLLGSRAKANASGSRHAIPVKGDEGSEPDADPRPDYDKRRCVISGERKQIDPRPIKVLPKDGLVIPCVGVFVCVRVFVRVCVFLCFAFCVLLMLFCVQLQGPSEWWLSFSFPLLSQPQRGYPHQTHPPLPSVGVPTSICLVFPILTGKWNLPKSRKEQTL